MSMKIVNGVSVPLTAQEEAERISEKSDYDSNVKPLISRRKSFIRAKEQAKQFDNEELDILLAGYLEVKLVRLAVLLGQTPGSVDTPVIDAFNAVFPGQTKLQIAQTIENRAQNYLTASATALANKIKDGG